MSANFVYLEGRVNYFKTRTTSTGKSVSGFRLEYTRGSKNNFRNAYIDVEAWELDPTLVETLSNIYYNIHRVAVKGAIDYDQWEDKSGNKRSKNKIVANRIIVISNDGSKSSKNSSPTKQTEQVVEEFEEDLPF